TRNWRALLSWGLTGAAMAILSAIIFGIDMWRDWLSALGPFQTLFRDSALLMADAITPYAVAERAGVNGSLASVAGAVVAVVAVVLVFRRREDVPARLIALVGGALLITPYAMHYDLALLAPAIAALPVKRPVAVLLVLLFGIGFLFNMGLACVLGALAAVAVRLAPLQPSPAAGTAS
ncbi:MAG: glycosyltransferase 87 family protein, partial [Pseudomonadota bacterium]|nr:glycosyltransferase 87 family protein [Pseudomonadota bacterium]